MPTPTSKAGDTVRLKSGGPTMTIREAVEDQLRCQWFDVEDYSQVREATFPVACVVPVEVNEPVAAWAKFRTGTYRSYAP